MKNSGIEWIGDIPDDWEILKTRYCFSIIGSGTTPESNNYKYYDGDFSWIQSGDLVKKNLYKTEKLITSQAFLDYSALKIYKAPFLVIAMYGASVGNSAVSFIDAATNQACCVLSECKENLLFLRYFFMAAQKPLIDEAKGGTQPNISQYLIKRFKICVPHSNVQQKIAEFLDKKCAAVDRLIENQSKQIEKLKEYKQSVITEAVTKGLNTSVPMKDSGIEWAEKIPTVWKVCRIKNLPDYSLANAFVDGDWIESPDISDTGIRYLTTGNVGDGIFKRQGNGCITEETFNRLNCKYAYPGDLVMSRLNSPYGRSCILPYDEDKYVLAVDIVILRTKNDKRYICYFTQCPSYQKLVEDFARGTAMKRISRNNLGNITILLPPIDEQRQIADYLDKRCEKIDKLIAIKQQKIEKLNEYKKSLIYEYVTGKKEVV